MTWTERTRYQASWGAWYVQIEIDGQVCELKFDHSPTAAEIDPLAPGTATHKLCTRAIINCSAS